MALDKSILCKELSITKKEFETEDSVSLTLSIPPEHKNTFLYKAGQFVTFFMDINGQEVRRSYSLASAPEADADFKVTIKRVPGGLGSNYLIDKTQAGMKLWTTPPAGLFVLPKDFAQYKLVFFAGGSGITPMISLIKSALHTHADTQCALLYQNRSQATTIFNEEIEQLQKKYPTRFVVQHIYSEPSADWAGAKGRIDKTAIRDFLAKNLIGIKALHFICGPEGFMKITERALADLGVDNSQISKESFLSPVAVAESTQKKEELAVPIDIEGVLIGDKTTKSKPEQIEAVFDAQTVKVSYSGTKTILETLLEAGHNPPYSCMDGACMACLAKVDGGLVYQNDLGILTDDNVDARECLTCQARPLSKNVKVNFDTY